ncbi:peptidase E [Micromonospora sp. NBC_01813]|uniref:Type 1 glutamine amidotransferase-like domain-containing protein n=1 Tax=Micromonospora sp. NBC_01813 TaxID=2975988 RepID=UPI002DDB26DA|nr:peptidase E [Micromonospora sp. NBC_01813]WSA06234.1 peptidase E [Micromonospora sp. NBC_01813]
MAPVRQIFAVSGILHPSPGRPTPRRSALIEHAISLTGEPVAKVCLVPTATGDSRTVIDSFYAAFEGADFAVPSHLQLFNQPNVDDVFAFLRAQHLIWVPGGSVVNLLAVWRAHRLDEMLRECWEAGVVLGGGSAGSLCWHVGGLTDSFSDRLDPVNDGLRLLPYSNGVHHDLSEQPRRSRYLDCVASGQLPAGYATDDGVGLHYVGTELVEAVSTVPGAGAYRIEPGDRPGTAVERPLPTRSIVTTQAESPVADRGAPR